MGFYRLQNDYYFNRKRIVDMDIVNDVTSTRQSVITRVVIRFFDDIEDIYFFEVNTYYISSNVMKISVN